MQPFVLQGHARTYMGWKGAFKKSALSSFLVPTASAGIVHEPRFRQKATRSHTGQ